eukprot:13762-Heterococcus_DN1.PRE.1
MNRSSTGETSSSLIKGRDRRQCSQDITCSFSHLRPRCGLGQLQPPSPDYRKEGVVFIYSQ